MKETASPEMRVLLQKAAEAEALATDGFCRAFIDATGIAPQEAEMVIANLYEVDDRGTRTIVRKIWFQKKGAKL